MRQHLVISMIALAIPINAAYAQASPSDTPVKPSPATLSPTNTPSSPKVTQTKPSLSGAQGGPKGSDRLSGGASADRLMGGAGNDVFLIQEVPGTTTGGKDILDYRRRPDGPPKITPEPSPAVQAAQQKK